MISTLHKTVDVAEELFLYSCLICLYLCNIQTAIQLNRYIAFTESSMHTMRNTLTLSNVIGGC